MQCMVCHREVSQGQGICPFCGFTQYQVIGDTKEAVNALEKLAKVHRSTLLRSYDLGVTAYTWKDQNGTVVQDQKKRLSFGTGEQVENRTVWLKQQFARIPGVREMTVELTISKAGAPERTIPVRIPVPQEKQLQQLGISMTDDLRVRLMLKNEEQTMTSDVVDFL